MRRWICCLIAFCLLLPIRFLHGEAETSDPAYCIKPAGADLIVTGIPVYGKGETASCSQV